MSLVNSVRQAPAAPTAPKVFPRVPFVPPTPVKPAKPADPRVYILSDSAINGLSSRADLVASFPFFRRPNIAAPRRMGCCRSRGKEWAKMTEWVEAVKRAVIALPPEPMGRLKQALHATTIHVYVRLNGKVVSKGV